MSNQPQPQQVTIDPEQALQLLDQAVSTIQTNREGHAILATCLQVLRQRIVSDQATIEQQAVKIDLLENNPVIVYDPKTSQPLDLRTGQKVVPLDSSALPGNTSHSLNGGQLEVSGEPAQYHEHAHTE